jgi:hypothetical protein
MKFNCAVCGKVFNSLYVQSKYCSPECKKIHGHSYHLIRKSKRNGIQDRFMKIYGRPGKERELEVLRKWERGQRLYSPLEHAQTFIEEL